jgi:hypothetical protein
MTSQSNPLAALRKTAIMFASICCVATAVGAATPLLAATPTSSAFRIGTFVNVAVGAERASANLLRAGSNA